MSEVVTFGSIFAGIGGFDLGFKRAGMICKWQVEIDEYCRQVEIDEYCRRVLAKHFPGVKRYEDVRECGAANLEAVDLICGGFPCQPVSCAGQRKGDADERWLWPEFHRVIREFGPRGIVVENVPGLLSIDAGRLFGTVLRDLAACGYDAEWDCIPAAAVGAPHIRDRVFILAYASDVRRDTRGAGQPLQRARVFGETRMADANSRRQQERTQLDGKSKERPTDGYTQGEHLNRCSDVVANADSERQSDTQGECSTAEPSGRQESRADGPWDIEPDVGRVADGVPKRVDRLRGLGNAVVPQVAEWIGRRIVQAANAT